MSISLLEKCRILFQATHNVKAKRFLTLFPPQETELYILFVTYQCEFSLYQITTKDINQDLPWDEFVQVVRCSEDILSAAKNVIRRAIKQFPRDQFDFEIDRPVKYFEDRDENDRLQMAQLFPDQEGQLLMQLFMLQAQAAHFSYLSRSAAPGYTWKTYLKDLRRDELLMRKLVRAFQDGLKKIDFEAHWLIEDAANEEGEST